MSKDLPNEVEDGFDLIEYPCEYGFKAMCRVAACGDLGPSQAMQDIVLKHIAESDLLAVSSNHSRTGKFESVTLTVRLRSRAQLEAVYQAVAASPLVVMTL